MYGPFPDALGDMISLQVFDLSNYDQYDDKNMRVMNIDLKNLCNLKVLNFESAFLQENITELLRNLPRCSPNKLQEMYLGFNQLTGMLPRWIGQSMSLVILDLTSNNITGPIPTSIGRLIGLQTLDLSDNHLIGNVPYEISMLSNLTVLLLDYNELDGVITEEHFASTRSLQYIDLSYNDLKIELISNWQPPSTFSIVHLAACQMGPLFPGWLQWHAGITELDISGAGIADRLPRSNQLTGQIPTMPPNITSLDLSNNSLRGPLPSDIGFGYLSELHLFSNQITGHIPESLCKYHHQLDMVDLSNNFLEGEVPPCLGALEDMKFIALRNNSFSGDFPSFVQNCTTMFFLDLSWNKFSGSLPMWIGKLVSLRILRLSHNNFSGNIPENITNLACLQYMDLSSNGISGSLPSNLSNLNVMRNSYMARLCDDFDTEQFHMFVVWKGQGLDYGTIGRVFDTNMMSIDLSSNSLIGEIPEEIITLDALLNLNLSRNNLCGVVPNKIGEMQSLESLDLSRNKLSGEIPTTLSNLTFLSYLDLSYNNLTGRIPSGSQLDTLYAANPSMYIGNIGLCERPLPNDCSSEGNASKQGGLGRGEESYAIEFFYLGLGCGFVVGIWMAFGVLLLKRSWRIACFQLPDKLYDKVYVLLATWARRTQID
ncbi:hypothetical protein U9M48_020490 [Paspalum notatum var. saurae]|uniref:Uncharacterized protein n=1 Tax=Paspalum notatum var. saurae TaxID=547442 RepID=A0AAQ3TED9_PASNO